MAEHVQPDSTMFFNSIKITPLPKHDALLKDSEESKKTCNDNCDTKLCRCK